MKRIVLRPAPVIAGIALVLAFAGSATAAKMVNGASVKADSLTGADVKNGNIPMAEFSSIAQTMLKGAKGAKGATGPAGDKGQTGPVGAQGPAGNPARVASKWSWFESRFLDTDGDNSGAADWFAYNDDAPADGTPDSGNFHLPNFQWAPGLDRSFETVLSLNSPNCNQGDVQGQDCAWGANDGGGVTVSWDSNITAVASISILHSQDSDTAAGSIPAPHTRISCFLSANRGTGSSDFDQIGARADISGFRQRQIETMTLTGSINRDSDELTDYMVRVECRDADGTNGRTRYYVLGGSLSVVATERG